MSTTTKARTEPKSQTPTAEPLRVGARNPYALTEIVLGRPVDWASVPDPLALVEEVLVTPREQLFDPKFASPVYLGARLDAKGRIVEEPVRVPGEPTPPEHDESVQLPEVVRTLDDLRGVLGDLGEVSVRSVVPARAGGWTIELAPGGAKAVATRSVVFSQDVLEKLANLVAVLDLGWTPAGGAWADTGRFFNEAAEYFDPVQGGLADCWLIAAMSAVAWALPGTIADASRATGPGNQQFVHRFTYRDPFDATSHTFEVSDETVVWQGTDSQLYGRSSEAGEIWPGVIEKAFAQWRQGTTNDHPNMPILNFGDPSWAAAALSGRSAQYVDHGSQTAAQLQTLVKSHSVSYRTVDPMTAWTYGTAPAGLSYDDAHIVANHAYSVLGWTSGPLLVRAFESTLARVSDTVRASLVDRLGFLFDPIVLTRSYVVLRNPWGYYEGTAGSRGGVISMRDQGFWRSINLDDVDGVFAIDFPTFQKYYATTGIAV